ncbi:ribonuclease HII [Allomuricauda sp. d1]|uniref:ribonuclease HII n=1 Tax=Allomuricauda sp. d1 TaxID=3136725 RepID=UPI0031E0739A
MAQFRSEVKNNDFLVQYNNMLLFKSMQSLIGDLEYVNAQNDCLVGFYKSNSDDTSHFVLLADEKEVFFDLQKANQKQVEKLTYKDLVITRYEADGSIFFGAHIGEKLVFSNSEDLLKTAANSDQSFQISQTLKKLFEAADNHKSANLFMQPSEMPFVFRSKDTEHQTDETKYNDWLSLDFNASQNMLNLSGIEITNDSLPNFLSLFKDVEPLTNSTASMAPADADGILSYTFNDYSSFAKNRDAYLEKPSQSDTLFNTIEEVGVIVLNSEKAITLGSFGTNNIAEFLTSKKVRVSDYQGAEITELGDLDLINETFNPLFKGFAPKFYTIIENTFVFCEKQETLKKIISDYKRGTTFDTTPAYESGMEFLASESNILLLSTSDGMDYFIKNEMLPNLFSDFKPNELKNHVFSAQAIADKTFFHTSFTISEVGKTSENNTVTRLFTLELDADLATNPQFVKNHRTNKQEIVVQDNDNNLYLISTEGKVLWKKQLNGRVQGRIEQVDLYKNGKLQLAFSTNNEFLILDRNGEVVEPFNMKFEGGNLNALAVFDYEKRKDYRFVVTQGQKVFMYNRKGDIVKGFKYTETESPIIAKPSHFRLGNRDYLTFQLENGALKIRHRAGQERIKVNKKIDFSENGIFLYKDKFSVTDKNGVLHQVATNGKLTQTDFNLNKDHGMYATSKTLALTNENILSIKGKKVELELGVYTAPKIFYVYDKIYVAVTDIQNKKIYLYDSQAKPTPNFPVFGGSMIDLMDIDNDRKLELVAKDQENSLIVYKAN